MDASQIWVVSRLARIWLLGLSGKSAVNKSHKNQVQVL